MVDKNTGDTLIDAWTNFQLTLDLEIAKFKIHKFITFFKVIKSLLLVTITHISLQPTNLVIEERFQVLVKV